MGEQKKYDVFISYSRKDLDEVSTFVEMLKTRIPTLEVWMDLEGITAADKFDEKIISAIDASSYVIFAVSPNSNSIGEGSSEWTKKELVYAKNTEKKVIPVLLNGAQLNSWFLFEFGRVDCIDSTSTHQIEKLLKNIARWSNKELVKPQKDVHVSQGKALLGEAKEIHKRIATIKTSIISTLLGILLYALFKIIISEFRTEQPQHQLEDKMEWNYNVVNDSIVPYTAEIAPGEYSLESIKIPAKIKHNDTTYVIIGIGDSAFYNCRRLRSISIPYSVRSIGKDAFNNCKSLQSINYFGTRTSWLLVKKGDKWNYEIPAKDINYFDKLATF